MWQEMINWVAAIQGDDSSNERKIIRCDHYRMNVNGGLVNGREVLEISNLINIIFSQNGHNYRVEMWKLAYASVSVANVCRSRRYERMAQI